MQNQPTFGFGANPTTQASTGGFQFGATPTSATGLFGTQTGAAKPTGFGTPTSQPAKTGFGLSTATSAPATGLTFGTPAAQPTAAPTFGTGLFGTTTPASSAAPSLGLFGATATTTPAAGLGTSIAPSSTSTGLTFGGTAATTGGLSFCLATATTTSAPLSFGLGTTTSAGTTPSFGTSTAPSFGASTTPSFGIGGATTSAPTLGFGLGGTAATMASSLTTTPSVVGLGGVAPTQTVVSTQKDVSPKDQTLPNEILQTVEGFKEMVKQQKLHSSDIARCSVRDFRKVESEIDHMSKLLGDVENQLRKNRHLAESLKYDTAKCLQTVEIAQRTQDTPPGLQYENTAPLKFFLDLADKFERDMQSLKLQIESADNYVKNYRNPSMLTPQDLALGIRRLHETFVALAGRLHSIHNQVESQKESYLNLRKTLFNDHSNPFEKLYKPQELSMNNLKGALIYSPPKVATGPTPFSNLSLGNNSLLLLQQSQTTPTFPGQTTTSGTNVFGGNVSFGTQAPSASLFGSTALAQNSNSFQLQKPPTGHKRGKQ